MKSTIEISELQAFVAVVRAGSFTAAAASEQSNKSQISRTVTRLEEKLQVRLLQRSTRRLSLTDVGKTFYKRANSILSDLEHCETEVSQTKDRPTGTLRITAGAEFGNLRVNKLLAEYAKLYPEVRVDASYTNECKNIIHEGYDLAIRVGPLQDSQLIARKIGVLVYGLYASRDYVRRTGVPKTPADLQRRPTLMFSRLGEESWRLQNGDEAVEIACKPRAMADSALAIYEMIKNDLGIGMLPRFMMDCDVKAGDIVPVLPEWGHNPVPIHALTASSKYMQPKIRAFIDLAKARLAPR